MKSLKGREPLHAEREGDVLSVARRLECDENKKGFETKLGKIAKARVVGK